MNKPCALCGKNAELQNSHLIPKHFYRNIERIKKNGTKVQFKTKENRLINLGRHVTQNLLCSDCENRFSKYGENYVAKQISAKTNSTPVIYGHLKNLKNSSLYCIDVPSLESDKIYYFALSITWRAAQEGWQNYKSIYLPPEDNLAIKQYLLSDGAPRFPSGYCLEVCISPPPTESIWAISLPTPMQSGNVFFNFNQIEFHIIKDQYLFKTYSSQGGVPIIYKLNPTRSRNITSGLIKAYKNSIASKNVTRLGQSPKDSK
jgi:hypothetical protein